MTSSDSSKRAYLLRLLEDFQSGVLESSLGIQEGIPGQELTESVNLAVQSTLAGRQIDEIQQSLLEAIVVPYLRPVYDIQDDTFPVLPNPWAALTRQSQIVKDAIRCVGRLEVGGLPGVPYGGTGFLVAPNLILTNRHVAELVSSSLGDQYLRFIPGRSATLDLKQEIDRSLSIPLFVRNIRLIHPYWDAALFEVDGVPSGLTPLRLASSLPESIGKRPGCCHRLSRNGPSWRFGHATENVPQHFSEKAPFAWIHNGVPSN